MEAQTLTFTYFDNNSGLIDSPYCDESVCSLKRCFWNLLPATTTG